MKVMAIKTPFVLAMLLMLSSISANVMAVDAYGGLSVGYTIADRQAPNDDEATTAGKIFFGAMLVGPVGIEATYYSLGKYNAGDDEYSGTGVTLVGSMEVGYALLFAKAGVINWKWLDNTGPTEVTDTNTTYGLGMNLFIDNHVMFRAELEHFTKVGEDTAGGNVGVDMRLISFGLNFLF